MSSKKQYSPPVFTSFEFFSEKIKCPVCGHDMSNDIVTEIPWSGCSKCLYQREIHKNEYRRFENNHRRP